MLLTPNRLEWGKCPYCKFELNCWDYVPADAVGAKYFQMTTCPNKKCGKSIAVKVRVTFKVEVIEGLE